MTKEEMKMVESFKAETECETLIMELRGRMKVIQDVAEEDIEWAMHETGRAKEYYAAQCKLHQSFMTLKQLDKVILAMAKEKEAKA